MTRTLVTLGLGAAMSMVRPAAAGAQEIDRPRIDRPQPARLRVEVGVASIYDTNIAHDEEELTAVGVVPSLYTEYRNRAGAGTYWLEAAVATHSYSQTDRYDRLSKMAAARIELPLAGPLSVGFATQLTLAGTSEDRVVNDQLMLSPRMIVRFGQGGLVRIMGAYRFRRSADGDHTGTNRYVALHARSRSTSMAHLELTSRYEINDAQEPRDRYGRWVHELGYGLPLGDATLLVASVQYTEQDYPNRPLEVDDVLVGGVRRDHKWAPGLLLEHEFTDAFLADLEYEFQRRDSSDPDKPYRAHTIRLTTRYRW